jgi:amino acid adenylation domain-containing protein
MEASTRLAHLLRRKGATTGQPIPVVMEKGWEQIVAVMGILAAGSAYAPIDPQTPVERFAYMLEQIDAKFVLTQSSLTQCLAWPSSIELLCVDAAELDSANHPPLESVEAADDLAYLLYTSGSTGDPKGVMMPHRGPVNTINYVNQQFEVGADDKAIALSALNFDLSVYDIFGLLSAGGSLVMPDADRVKDPAHWAELMAAHRVTIWNSVPTLMRMMLEYLSSEPERTPPGLRLVLLSGDWIPVDLPDRIRKVWEGVQVVSLGGPTETSVWNISYPIDEVDPSWPSIPYGRPITNNRYDILDGRLDCRPDWVPGELFAEGTGLARGYWRSPELNAAKFLTHPLSGARIYRTGDLGRYRPDGTIEILGRVDFQVKINGYRIELGEIEATLLKDNGVADVVVCAPGETHADRRLIAYVVPVDKSLIDEAEVSRKSTPGAGRGTGIADDAFLGGGSVSLQAEGILLDPIQRIEFKLGQLGLRRPEGDEEVTALPRREFDQERSRNFLGRHTSRSFLDQPVPITTFSRFLDCLEQMSRDDSPIPKRLYPSAGSLYPVQIYLHIKPGRVEGLKSGSYYYDPEEHRLFLLEPGASLGPEIHVETNREIFLQAAFSVLMIGKLGAIEPIYGKTLARDFCMLEAGYIGQLLMHSGAEHGVGICPIGALDFASARDLFHLESDHVLLHSIVGGIENQERPCAPRPFASEGAEALIGGLRSVVEAQLPSYMAPSGYVLLPALPISANGKVDRRALTELALARRAPADEMVLPRNELEQNLADMVKQILKLESVSVNANFFDLGATSVSLVQIRGKLVATLGKTIPIVDMFRHPTISFLAKYLSEGGQDGPAFDVIQREAERRRAGRSKRRERRLKTS